MTNFKVSVIMITYGHEKFISEAIEGVLKQKISAGSIELIIADDCSPDKTSEAVAKYAGYRDPNFSVKYCRHESNKGVMENLLWALEQAKGEFIAVCEGDDYWTDPLKLQKQIEFLEAHQEYVICSHSVKYLYQKDGTYGGDTHKAGDYKIKDLAVSVPFQFVSVIFRNDLKVSFPKWLLGIPNGDWGIYLYLMQNGKAKKMEDVMGVYRIHEDGVWSGQRKKQTFMKFTTLSILKNKFSKDINSLLIQNFLKHLIMVFSDFIKAKQYQEAIEIYERYQLDIPVEYRPLFEVAPSALIASHEQLLQKDELINNLIQSSSYKLGNKMINILKLVLPFKKEGKQ